ncbi:MAG: Cytochrome c family protein [Labilithrix sp.]|nr:Cytochrome c family protein [Labilithrix sp.]
MPSFAVRLGLALASVGSASALGSGCSVERSTSSPPTYDGAVAPLLAARCATCHGAIAPAAGWSATTYLDAVACTADGTPVTLPASGPAPIVRVLGDPTHAALLSGAERDLVVAWVNAGTPKFRGTAHAPSFVDPRSDQSHGRMLRSKQWKPMLDADDPAACGRCHDGAPSRPSGITTSAPGAPACTTCHQEPGGALGCNTCHGGGAGEGAAAKARARSYPPRSACFFPADAAVATAHAAHVEGDATHANGVACSTCHPMPGNPVIGGAHANGHVEVQLDTVIAGKAASFDATTKACATTCHAGPAAARPVVAWTDRAPAKCGDCHSSPPPDHFEGSCTGCHREVNAKGDAFVAPALLHVNGHVDVGDGSGACGACHGKGNDPWPATAAHPAHQHPAAAAAAPCESCHAVPTAYGPGTGHPRGGRATVALTGRAAARGTQASFTGGSCQAVYCHGAGLEGTVAAVPSWTDLTGSARACGACHAAPPAAPHPASPACDLCHRDAVVTMTGPAISPAFAAFHVNGVVDRGGN